MNMLRNRFLGTSAQLLAAAGEGDGTGGEQGKPTVLKEDVGAEDDDNGGSNGAEGEGGTVEGDGGAGEGEGEPGAGDDDEDPDLAELPPEMREKAKKALERRLAKETGWRDRQIDRLHRQKRETQEDNRALTTIADPARRAAPVAGEQKTFTEADVEQRASQKLAQDRYDQGCIDTDSAGREYFTKEGWDQRTGKLAKLGGVNVEDMISILATDNPAMVIDQLAADPDAYERVMALPPARRNNEFVKMGLKAPPKKAKAVEESLRPGETPPPPRRLQGSGRQVSAQTVNLYEDKVEDEKWYEERNKTRRKKFSNVG